MESPSLKWRTLDFCLQLISSNKVNFSISVRRLIYSSFSSAVRACVSPLASNAFNLLQSCHFLKVTLPNPISSHYFRSNFKLSTSSQYIARSTLEHVRCPPNLHLIHKLLRPQPSIFKPKRNSPSPLTPPLQ